MPLAKKRWNPFLLYPIITIQVLPYIFRTLNTNDAVFIFYFYSIILLYVAIPFFPFSMNIQWDKIRRLYQWAVS